MKKSGVLLLTFLFTMTIVLGQTQKAEKVPLKKLEGSNISPVAKRNFSSDFKDAKNVEWKRIDTYDKASFTGKDGQKMSAFYDIEGKLVGTTMIKTFADVPENAQKEIKKSYNDYTIDQVVFYDDNENNDTDMILYGTQFEDTDSYFVELTKGAGKIVLQVSPIGEVFPFKKL
jgi:hypothetical protein